MPIEFHCPGCGNLMRTPDETAGRKGKCPNCGVKVMIPGASLKPASVTPLPQPPQPEVPTMPVPAMSVPAGQLIRFYCELCNHSLAVPQVNAGKKGKCPRCGGVIKIPAAAGPRSPETGIGDSRAARPASPANRNSVPSAPPSGSNRLADSIRFHCPGCEKPVRVAAAAAGGQAKCPHCLAVFTVPQPPVLLAPSRVQPPVSPLPRLDSVPGLTPLGPAGAFPLDPTQDSPLGDSLFSNPLGYDSQPDPFGATLAASTPFAGLGQFPTSSPLGSPINPYAPPAAYGYPLPASKEHAQKPKRSGLPWDREEEGGFWKTAKLVLFSPKDAFYKMRRTGGVGRPMLFCVTGTLTGAMFSVAYNFIAQLGLLLMAGNAVNMGPALIAVLVGGLIGMVVGLAIAAVIMIVFSFVYAGILHLCLMMVGGARQPFETTYRICCYALGSSALCGVVPILGSLVGFVFQIVAIVVGCWTGHEISLGKAVMAVLIPFIVWCVLLIGIAMLVVSAIAAAQTA